MQKKIILIMDYRYDEGVRPRKDKICPCITTHSCGDGRKALSGQPLVVEKWTKSELSEYRIRKLTPLETWRLMGFTDEDFYEAKKVNPDSKLYKQAGNSIVVNVLEAVFCQMI